MHRQAERLSKDGAAKAVEPTLIQLSKRWQDFESKFAQFRRLNYAQIVSCYWQTHTFATATTNSILLTMRASGSVSTLQILIRKALLSAAGGSFIYSDSIVICFGLKIALKLNQSITKKLSNEIFVFISVASLFFHNVYQFKNVSLPCIYFFHWTCKTQKLSFPNYPSHANFNWFFCLSITCYTHFGKWLEKFLWLYIYITSSSNAWTLKQVFVRKCNFKSDRMRT